MTSTTSPAGLLGGLVLCCLLSTAPVRGDDPAIQVIPAVRQVAEAESSSLSATTVGWRHGHWHGPRHVHRYGHWHGPGHWHLHSPGWGHVHYRSARPYYRSYYYGGFAPYYRTSYYAPTYYAPAYPVAPAYTVRYAPIVYSYRPVYYYAPSVRVLYGGYGYYYPAWY